MGRRRKPPVTNFGNVKYYPECYSEMPPVVAAVIPVAGQSHWNHHVQGQVPGQSRFPPKSPIRRVVHNRIFCSVCAIEMDLKPVIEPEMMDTNINGGLAEHQVVSLDALCTLGQGIAKSMTRDCFMDKNTPCQLCDDCFGIVEDVRELKQNIELLKAEMSLRVVALKSRIDDSPTKFGHKKRGRIPNDLANLKAIQKVLGRAFGPELLPNPVAANIMDNPTLKTERLERPSTSVGSLKVDSVFDFNGHRILTVPVIKSEFGGTVDHINETATTRVKVEPTFSGTCRPKRKYVKKEPLIKYEPDLSDDDYSPKKQQKEKKRKYVRRKPLKRELYQIDEENDCDFGDDFVIPIIKSVKTENGSPRLAKGLTQSIIDSGDAQWLADHIEVAQKGVILRSTLYHHYFEHCMQNKRVPPNQASFGKLVKHVFHGIVGVRRLGTRGNSVYCHTGIRIKANSPLNDVVEQYDVEEDNSRKYNPKSRGKHGLLIELGIKVPPRAPNAVIRTTLFGSVSTSGLLGQTGGLPLQFMPPLPLDLDSSLNLDSGLDNQPVDNILRDLMS